MKKVLFYTLSLIILVIAFFAYQKTAKILPFYSQLSQTRIGTEVDLQSIDQKKSHYVGSSKCLECHKDEHKSWSHSRHPKMVQDPNKNPSVVVADFNTLPDDANFELKDVIYTVGGKFKQRFMLQKDRNGTQDYVIGNYQWNAETKKWQSYKSWNDWYKDGFVHDNNEVPTSRTCDGCHFTGFMSTQKRVEPGISCESCHGPSSEHVKNPESSVFDASKNDPVRQNEVCLQCHMRNIDIRLKDKNISEIFGDVRDYPMGYEPGRPLSKYKLVAPFILGQENKKFYANGMGKKNRMQGNEFVHSMKSKHGITCINCHNPHTLKPNSTNSTGNDLCMKCHDFGSSIGPHQDSLRKHTMHKADSKGSLCVECHMPKVGKHTGKSPFTVRTHMFGFVTPKQTLQYNMPKETNACFACHKEDRDMQTLQNDLEKWGMVAWNKR